jgi:DNA-binding transcriptional regulator YiaG
LETTLGQADLNNQAKGTPLSEAAISTSPGWAKRVRRARYELGLNQQTFAERLGVHVNSVGAWETGKSVPTPQHLQALSRLTQHPISYFTELIPDEEL